MASCTPANQLLWYVVDYNDDANYDADQDFDAAYAMLELPVHPKIDVIGGVRYEATYLHSQPEDVLDGTIQIVDKIATGDRYLIDVPQDDPRAVADLDEASWLPSLSAVYISFSVAGNTYVQPVNYQTGSERGAEFEARSTVAKGLNAGINATWIDSEVDVPQAEQDSLTAFALDEPTRKLQGQPAYLLNVFFTYDLFYNRTGETLVSGAATGLDAGQPDVLERALSVLDFTASQKINKNVIVSFRARNLLQPDRGTFYRNPQDAEVPKFERDTSLRFRLSVGLKW